MTPRGTDWSLAVLVGVLAASGLATLFAGAPSRGWVFAAHDIVGFALAAVLVWKLRRVLPPRRGGAGIVALGFVALTLVAGWAWATGANVSLLGYSLLSWHFVLGATLAVAVLAHAVARAKRPRRRDVASRRQFLQWGGVGAGAVLVWQIQKPLSGVRRFTGSYESASLEGNAFPSTSWVSDAPRELGARPVLVTGLVRRSVTLTPAEIDVGDERVAVLDCTGGFWSRQRWRGTTVAHLLDRAGGVRDGADHVRVVSHTGYRWTFGLDEAERLLLATHVGGEVLSHAHGAPVRLVAPGRRGFQWVKWVVRVEAVSGPDPGAAPSTVWSSFTAEGRGKA